MIASAKTILRARARALAQPPQRRKLSDVTLDVVEFRLAREAYAVEYASVREVIRLEGLTPLPCVPSFVRGIVNVRGQILPVIDIKTFFDLPDAGITDMHRVIVVHADGVELGLLADAVVDLRSIPLTNVQATLPTLTGVRADYLRGVTDDHVVILDIPKILADPRILVNEEVAPL